MTDGRAKGSIGVEIREDRWFSEVFGHGVFEVAVGDASTDAGGNLKDSLRDHFNDQRRAFYFAKVGTAEVGLIRGLCGAGFYVVDANVTFSRGVDGESHPTGAIVRECDGLEPTQRELLLGVAATCFRYSRFHLDPLIPEAVANEIKRRWIGNYIIGKRGEKLFVAFEKDRPAGFLAAMTVEFRGKPHGAIDLIGVDPELQGRGIGTALVNRFIDHYRGKTSSILVGTQAANIPSLQFYTQIGFTPVESTYILHAHVDGGCVLGIDAI